MRTDPVGVKAAQALEAMPREKAEAIVKAMQEMGMTMEQAAEVLDAFVTSTEKLECDGSCKRTFPRFDFWAQVTYPEWRKGFPYVVLHTC